jgi:hypothetical protein
LGGVKPSITYGPKDNRVKVSIASFGGWTTKELHLPSEEEGHDKEKDENEDALVGAIHPGVRVLHPVSSILHPVSSVLHPVSSVPHPVSSVLHPGGHVLHHGSQ